VRIALKVFYDGGPFYGSQRQPGRRTVEGELLRALERAGISFTDFKAAGRTDRGVSALGNVYALTKVSGLLTPRLLNSVLPVEIRVVAAQEVEEGFNPRHARERVYKYFLFDEGLSIPAMEQAARELVGRKSFHNFSSRDYRDPVRELKEVSIAPARGVVVLSFTGESFLWQMVRRITTALRMAGKGELGPEDVRELLKRDVRRKLPPSEPENLVLWDVRYSFTFRHEEYARRQLLRMLERRWRMHKVGEALWAEALSSVAAWSS